MEEDQVDKAMRKEWVWAVNEESVELGDSSGLGEVVMMKRRESGCRRSGGFVW